MEPFARIPGRSDDFIDRAQIIAIECAVGRRRRSSRIANLGTFTGYRIGLDIGNGNIGWCILFEGGSRLQFLTAEDIAAHNSALPRDKKRTQLPGLKDFVPLGTYKFEARENSQKGEKSLSKIRAEAKAKERMLDARQWRRFHVKKALREANLWPKEDDKFEGHVAIKGDVLRVKLLDPSFYQNQANPVHRHDLGRALYNALQRRGYMKPVGRAGLKEDSKFGSKATEAYRDALEQYRCRTIGEFLERCSRDARRDKISFRKRHKSLAWQKENKRRWPKNEANVKSYEALQFLSPTFTIIWEECEKLREAARTASIIIDDEAWSRIKGAAEFRRELEAKEPGRCKYFKDEYRCIRALSSFQQFRILEQISNLRNQSGETLHSDAFSEARCVLDQNEKITLAALSRQLETKLKLDKHDDTASRYLIGAKTDIALNEVLGEKWKRLTVGERDDWTMRFLRRHWPEKGDELAPWREADEAALEHDAAAAFGSGALEEIAKEAANELDDKFSSISVKAACLLARCYEQRLSFEERQRALQEAGAAEPEIALYERLPYYGAVMPDVVVPARGFAPKDRTVEEEWRHGRAANPDVHVVMNRLRIVINEIIDMMGGMLPTACVIEMARSAFSEDQANAYSRTATARKQLRERIVAKINAIEEGLGSKPPIGPALDRLVDRWKAAIRQGWRDYDGSRIQPSMLVDGSTYQLDHVMPAAFGDFRENNMFVSRFNQAKRRRLPWEAFNKDPNFRPALIAFATFGLEQQIKGLEFALNPKPPRKTLIGKYKTNLEERLTRARKELSRLSELDDKPRPDVLDALNRTLTNDLDALIDGDMDSGEQTRQKEKARAFRPSDQAALFRRFCWDSKEPQPEPAARDIANIGWNTKLTLRYLRHLGAEPEAVKAWAGHALRCMFNINKDRTDLRNHAVDAFLVAHFDKYTLRPAFDCLRRQFPYEAIFDPKALQWALSTVNGGSNLYTDFGRNLDRLDRMLQTIGTAHRADHRWNPGDRAGGTFGAFGGENLYAFRPTTKEREVLTIFLKGLGEPISDRQIMTRKEILDHVKGEPKDEKDRTRRKKLAAEIELRYMKRSETTASKGKTLSEGPDGKAEAGGDSNTRNKKPIQTPAVTLDYTTALPLSDQVGAFIDGQGKFAIIGDPKKGNRQVISLADFSQMSETDRLALFANRAPVYRRGDTVIYEDMAYVVTGLQADTRLIAYPVDDAPHAKECKNWITPGPSVVKLSCDVLGRRVHQLRKDRRGLDPLPYKLRG